MPKFLLAGYLLICLFSTASAQTYSGPESVEWIPGTHDFLISNTTSHQVLRRSGNGSLSLFASGFTSGPHGLELAGDTLYCCSGGHLLGYRLSTGLQAFDLNLNATFLNGITHDLQGNVFATDFSANKIYRISRATLSFDVFCSGLPNTPNGILFDAAHHRLLVVTWGNNAPVLAASLLDSSISTLTNTSFSNCDGIQQDTSGHYYVTAWGTQSIYQFDSLFAQAPVQLITGLHNPADIGYCPTGDTLAIPNAGNNTVVFYHLHSDTVSTGVFLLQPQRHLFPNPIAVGQPLLIQCPGQTQLTLSDLQGRVLVRQTIEPGCPVATDGLIPGLYLAQLAGEGFLWTEKLLIR